MKASAIGAPAPGEIDRETRPRDLDAIASFNLLGVQSKSGNVDWNWLAEVVQRLQKAAPGPETDLFATRDEVLTGRLSPAKAVDAYAALLKRTPADLHFTYTGVTDRTRIDSFFDPFGNLTVRQRLYVELARENHELGRNDEAARFKRMLLKSDGIGDYMRAEIEGYWKPYVEEMK